MIGICQACGKDPGFGSQDWYICPHCGSRPGGAAPASPAVSASPSMSNPGRFDDTMYDRPGAGRRERASFDGGRDFYRPVDSATVRADPGPAWGDAPARSANGHLDDRTIFDRGRRGGDEAETSDHTVIIRGGRKGIRGPLAYVVERNGIRAGRVHFVGEDTGIGRDAANDVVLGDETVSRRHARIRIEDGKFVFWDLASANFSFAVDANGTKSRILEPRPLADGDTVELGDARLTFLLVDHAPE